MNKNTLRKVILSINEASLECDNRQDLLWILMNRTDCKEHTIRELLELLEMHHCLEWLDQEVDLFPCAVIFARSRPDSLVESVALWEMFHHDPPLLSKLGWNEEDPTLQMYTRLIEKESPGKIVSDTLSILYTDSIILKGKNITYKNEDRSIVNLPQKDFLLRTMPKRGIPANRDISKDLQVYFKDTLMHEFNRTCPVCGIHIPHMLIASHIKPFRDCAHIFEAADHNNGLLLCRNHDYLFDQGYITYDDHGHLILSKQLKHPELYALRDIDSSFMTFNRRLYMEYHRKHIFKDIL